VLFAGTPCQIEGLKRYLGKEYDNLYTQDLICHGVPSPRIWNEYVKYRIKKANSNLKNVEFRGKVAGWKNFSFVMRFENGSDYIKNPYRDRMMNMFLFNKNLRPICHECPFKKIGRVSDYTVADFWGIKYVAPELDDNKGTSLMLLHSEKAKKLFENVKEKAVFKEVDFELATKRNPMVKQSAKKHVRRARLMKNLNKLPFEKFLKRYGTFLY